MTSIRRLLSVGDLRNDPNGRRYGDRESPEVGDTAAGQPGEDGTTIRNAEVASASAGKTGEGETGSDDGNFHGTQQPQGEGGN